MYIALSGVTYESHINLITRRCDPPGSTHWASKVETVTTTTNRSGTLTETRSVDNNSTRIPLTSVHISDAVYACLMLRSYAYVCVRTRDYSRVSSPRGQFALHVQNSNWIRSLWKGQRPCQPPANWPMGVRKRGSGSASMGNHLGRQRGKQCDPTCDRFYG